MTMFEIFQEHQLRNWSYRSQLLLDSWNALSRLPADAGRLILFFGSSNLFSPYSMDRQLQSLLRHAGSRDVVLNMGSFGFGDSTFVLQQTIAAIEAYRARPIDLLIYEVTPNEMPPLAKEVLPSIVGRTGPGRLILDYHEARRIRCGLQEVPLPLRENLARLVLCARAATPSFPVLLLDYDMNVRQWPPALSGFSRETSPAESAAARQALAMAVECFRGQRLGDALDQLRQVDAIDPSIALAVYLRAKIADASGDQLRARTLYREACRLDLVRGRLFPDELCPGLDQWCASLGCWYVPVPPIVSRCAHGAIPGFDVFVDDVHYRPAVHFAIAASIAERLSAERFLDSLPAAREADILRDVDRQQLFVLLQTACNVVMPPHSPFNDERVAQAFRCLDAARDLGCDRDLLEQYRLKVLLLAGLEQQFADQLAAQPGRDLDAAALLLGEWPAGDTHTSPVVAEVERQLRALLLIRFGLAIGPAETHVELSRFGVDSLALAGLILMLEERFDTTLDDAEAAGFDRGVTFASLAARIGDRLLHPATRRLAREKGLARQRILERQSSRAVSADRLRGSRWTATQPAVPSGTLVSDIIEHNIVAHADRSAVCWMDGASDASDAAALTWRALGKRSAAFAAYFAASGIKAWDVIHLLTGHGLDTVAAIVGALRIGAVPSVGHEPSSRISERAFFETFGRMVRTTSAAAIVLGPQIDASVRRRIAADAGGSRLLESAAVDRGYIDFQGQRPAGADARAPVLLQHSSGTTGARKGVAISHQNLLDQVRHYARAIDLRDGDRIASWLPLYHDMGLIACLMLPLITATPLVLMSPFAWISRPGMLFDAITGDRSTLIWLPNFAFNVLADRVSTADLADVDLSSVRSFINCSEPIRQDSWQRFYDRFAFHGLSRFARGTCYAMAEFTFAVTQGGITEPAFVDFVAADALRRDGVAIPQDDADTQTLALVSSGRPINGCDIRIVGPRGEILPDRIVGEIHITGDSLTAGYYNMADVTARAFADGWYRTGDSGYRVDGHLVVLGRADDTIVANGQKFMASDIDDLVSLEPGIRPGRVAAFGVFDAQLGTEQLFVLAEPAADVLDEEGRRVLHNQIRACLADNLQLTTTQTFLLKPNTLRKTSSGKVSHATMKALFLDGQLGDAIL
jgi:acyl-CoA synthetase (AMP-forming)/AMP-acid ligase II/acyl carrier protein